MDFNIIFILVPVNVVVNTYLVIAWVYSIILELREKKKTNS